MVAYAGIYQSIAVIVISVFITTITTLSLSAICTNGEVAGGGAYYMISRSLGAEFGGSIGVTFFFANAVAVALYLIGFAETISKQMSSPFTGSEINDMRIIAFGALFLIQVLCLRGVGWVIKFQLGLLGLLVISILAFFVGAFLSVGDSSDPAFLGFEWGRNTGDDYDASAVDVNSTVYNISKVEADNLQEKAMKTLDTLYGTVNFGNVLAVFFPAVTGVMAGANISGDLKNPGKAIPKETFLPFFAALLFTSCSLWYLAALQPVSPWMDRKRGVLVGFSSTRFSWREYRFPPPWCTLVYTPPRYPRALPL